MLGVELLIQKRYTYSEANLALRSKELSITTTIFWKLDPANRGMDSY